MQRYQNVCASRLQRTSLPTLPTLPVFRLAKPHPRMPWSRTRATSRRRRTASDAEAEPHTLVGGDSATRARPGPKRQAPAPVAARLRRARKEKHAPELPADGTVVYYGHCFWVIKAEDKVATMGVRSLETAEELTKMVDVKSKKEDWPEIHNGEGRPDAEQLSPAQIVILKGRHNKRTKKNAYGWYIRLSVKGVNGTTTRTCFATSQRRCTGVLPQVVLRMR